MPDELPESARRADRGFLARHRRSAKDANDTDATDTGAADSAPLTVTAESSDAKPGIVNRVRTWLRRAGGVAEAGGTEATASSSGHEAGASGAAETKRTSVAETVPGGTAADIQAETAQGATAASGVTGSDAADRKVSGPAGDADGGKSVSEAKGEGAPKAATTADPADVAGIAAATVAEVAEEAASAAAAAAAEVAESGGIAGRRGKSGELDPITDMKTREREAGVDERFPFGRPGRPLGRNHPFVFGFYGALGVLVAYMLVQALTNARQVIILIVVALFLAVGLNPGVKALERIGVSRRWAVMLVFLALVGFFVGFGFAIVPPLSEQTTAIIHNLTSGHGYLEQLQNNPKLRDLDNRYHLLQRARTALQNKDLGTRAANGVVGVGQVVLSGVFSTLTVLILTLYFLTSLPNITGFMYRLAPRSRRARVALLGDEILVRIGGYVAGNLLISLIAGLTTYIYLLIVGVPYALALSLLVAITDLIPLVGATIGAIFVTALAFFSGLWTGIAVAIFFLIYQQVENYVVQPRVMKRSVDVQPAVTIIAALIGGALLGVIGALLAIPAAAALALILREVVMPRQEEA